MIGRTLAHYEVTAHLGSGGMGEVYQATDTRLGRMVALKVLPDAFANDVERAARFAREARTLASLNHPHIAAIHGIEESDGRRFLVMELVPGQTLDERIKRLPLSLDEALSIARQIAEALEAAHDKGVVHRDLKPANVKITPDGQVKVLDFGLAKLVDDNADDASETRGNALANSPTMAAATQAGVILGTAAYMAPEQARGRLVDRRADIFAFGCVLYEMLARRPAFEGDNIPDILSRVLQREPDWTRLPANVPMSVRRLLQLCLEKDPKKRRQAAGDVRIDLEQALTEPEAAAVPAPGGGSRAWRFALLAAALASLAAVSIPAIRHLREVPPAELRLEIVTPSSRLPLEFALAPDGRSIVFVADSPRGSPSRLHVRVLNSTDVVPIAGTENARLPFWSPDSRSVGFFASGYLQRIEVTGGTATQLAPAPAAQGGAWSPDDTIVFAPNTVSPILQIAASGGEATPVTDLDAPSQLGHRFPFFLVDGRKFLFFVAGEPHASGIFLGSLDGGPSTRLTAAESPAQFLPPDRILFVRQGTLVASRLDVSRRELTGDSVTMAARVGGFSVSAAGTVAHRASPNTRVRGSWFDRSGNDMGRLNYGFNGPELSPDGRRVAFDRTIQGDRDVWMLDLLRDGLTRLTTDPAVDGYPVWSPDGSEIVFDSSRRGTFDLWIKPSSGAGADQLLFETPDAEIPLHWSADGRFLLYQRTDLKEMWDLWALPMTGEPTPVVVANTPFMERMGQFSPDGRWIAYETNESGRTEVVVQAFPEARSKWPVSTSGGGTPRWSADGREIYFIGPDGTMMASTVEAGDSTFDSGRPTALFSTDIVEQPFRSQYAVSRDGRFLVNEVEAQDATPSPITLILNWRP